MWLAGQLWPLLVVAALAGAALVLALGQRRETVEVWEEVPDEGPEPFAAAVTPAGVPTVGSATSGAGSAGRATGPAPDERAAARGAALAGVMGAAAPASSEPEEDEGPFPFAAPGERAPWEEEELWSRPARAAERRSASPKPADEWEEAAQNWRLWADESAGRDSDLPDRDRDLFAADRSEPDAGWAETPAAGPVGAPAGGPVDIGPAWDGEDDPFPHARPVEADELLADAASSDDDETEAAEIRRMREQAARGDAG